MSEAALRLTIKAQKVRIEGLEAEITRMRAALRLIVERYDEIGAYSMPPAEVDAVTNARKVLNMRKS